MNKHKSLLELLQKSQPIGFNLKDPENE